MAEEVSAAKKRKVTIGPYVTHEAMRAALLTLCLCLKRCKIDSRDVRRMIAAYVPSLEYSWSPQLTVERDDDRRFTICSWWRVLAPPGLCWRPLILHHMNRVPYPHRSRLIAQSKNDLTFWIGRDEAAREILDRELVVAAINLVVDDE